VTTVVSGLTIPWDLTWVGDLLLYDLRGGQIWSRRGSAAPALVSVSGFPTVFASGEAGLMGMVADPDAASNRRFYTCVATRTGPGGGPQDVRVLRWRLTSDTTAESDGAPVVTGIPLADNGRHSGCRLRFGADGRLYVGTGDAATGTVPQDLQSLGGKVLRVGGDGTVPADNPFAAQGGNARYVWSYGHRNLQGLATRPGSGSLYSAEHGTSRDDEVNWIVNRGNYGWDPVPGYDEGTPMTDLAKFPAARRALWSSGAPTVATSGATFLVGPAWGRHRGWLAVAMLKGSGVLLMQPQPATAPQAIPAPEPLPEAQGFGRIRTVQTGPDGSLWFTTSNGGGADRIVRVTPSAPVPSVAAGRLVSGAGVTVARTGTAFTAFVRGDADRVRLRRSTDDARTWGGWTDGGVSSSDAPSATSSASGRIDLATRSASRRAVHTWYLGGVRGGSTDLGGAVLAQHLTSPGDGTLDLWAVGTNGTGWWRHRDGSSWGPWRYLGGIFTSGLSASADASTGRTVVSGRGADGRTWSRTFAARAAGPLAGWAPQGDGLSAWSDRGLGDTPSGGSLVTVGLGPDSSPVVQRGQTYTGVSARFTSAVDVVTRADGTFLLAGRGGDGGLWLHDGRPGRFVNVDLGGTVR
jgi:glucose/arabinose dehydrogenase